MKMRKQLFEAAFSQLSVNEMVALKRADLEDQKLEVKRQEVALALDKFQWDAAARVLKAVKENPKLLRDMVTDTTLTEEQRITKIIGSLWGASKTSIAQEEGARAS